MDLVLQLVKPLLAAALILALAWVCARSVGKTMGRNRAGRRLRILEQTPCGRDLRLILAEWGEKQLLIGAGPDGLRLLAEREKGEKPDREEEPAPPETQNFCSALTEVMEKMKKRGGKNHG